MFYPARGFPLAVGILLMLGQVAFGGATIIYDNYTTYPTSSEDPENLVPEGFFPFNFYGPNEPMGEEIILAGTKREVVQFDLVLKSSIPTTLDNLTLTLGEWIVYSEEKEGWYLQELWTGIRQNVSVVGTQIVSFTCNSQYLI